MKRSLLLLAACSLFAAPGLALADSARLVLDNQKLSQQVSLEGQQSHIEYRQVDVPYTCYSHEFAGYETVCAIVPQTTCGDEKVCTNQPTEICHTTPEGVKTCETVNRNHCEVKNVCETHDERVCSQEPRYVDVAQTCHRTDTVRVDLLDYIVHANVKVNVNAVPVAGAVKDVIKVELSGADLKIDDVDAKSGLLYIVSESRTETITREEGSGGAGEKVIDVVYTLEAIRADEVTSSLRGGIQDVRLEKDVLQYSIGKVLREDLVGNEIEIRRKRLIGSKKLVETAIDPKDVMIRDQGDRSLVAIDLTALKLSESLESGKEYKIRIKVGARDASGRLILNPKVLGRDAEVKVKQKL